MGTEYNTSEEKKDSVEHIYKFVHDDYMKRIMPKIMREAEIIASKRDSEKVTVDRCDMYEAHMRIVSGLPAYKEESPGWIEKNISGFAMISLAILLLLMVLYGLTLWLGDKSTLKDSLLTLSDLMKLVIGAVVGSVGTRTTSGKN